MVERYGSDSRFQRFAFDLANWYQRHDRLIDAAREYRGVAERANGMSPDEVMGLLFQAGQLYSAAAYDAIHKKQR